MGGIVKQGKWGVCGFVSVLNALHMNGKLKEFGTELGIESVQKRLVAEVITYLKVRNLQNPTITNEILTFTKSFGHPYNRYTGVPDLIRHLERELKSSAHDTASVINQGGIGVAMPTNAVADYADFAGAQCSIKRTVPTSLSQASLIKHRECAVGIGYNGGLRHWVYVDNNGNLYNWGSVHALADSSAKPPNLDRFSHIYGVVQL
ncbi:hypothetical protein [Fodinicurvata sp. EGI_FJ10296]|uniref:hypothetical protein n=1 Tax=Fodinicurvata sp. EGI_FJ10296 TaxID=3231908 RepID=UPI00345128D8